MVFDELEDSSSKAAAMLLAIAPDLLASKSGNFDRLLQSSPRNKGGGSIASDLECAAGQLLRILSEALKGEPKAVGTASQLVRAAALSSPSLPLRVTAARDLLYRSIMIDGDAGLRTFAVAANKRHFANQELIDAALGQFKIPSDSRLAGANILACRHLLGSTVAELAAVQTALPDAKLFEVMGKPYSANPLAVDALIHRGLEVNEESYNMPELPDQQLGTFAHRHGRIARSVVERFLRTPRASKEALLVIDDGGALINAVGRKIVSGEIQVPVVAIEQTTHGLFAVQEFLQEPNAREHGFALISVSDSFSKLDEESPLIASSVIQCAAEWLQMLHFNDVVPQAIQLESARIGIIGFGPIGAIVAKMLPGHPKITVFDRNRRKLVLAKSSGHNIATSIGELLSNSEIVIAASGGKSLDAEAAQHLVDGAILVSASSGDLEFSGLNGWSTKVTPTLATSSAMPYDRAHGLITATHSDGRRAYVLNRGFPVNFDGGLDPIGVQDIQLTRALIVGAVLQAAGASETGSVVGLTARFDLDGAIDHFIGDEFRKIKARQRSSHER